MGRLLLASTPAGLVRLEFLDGDPDDVLEELAETLSPGSSRIPSEDPARRQLEAYFEGRVHRFRTALDWSLAREGFAPRARDDGRDPLRLGLDLRGRRQTRREPRERPARPATPCTTTRSRSSCLPPGRAFGGGVGKYGGQEWRKEYLLRLEGALAGP